jgi:diadenosine tetraphosphate (Ap4A) HIT family hydrolase
MDVMTECAYCENLTDRIIWANGECRVMFVDDSTFAGWCRVIWHEHKTELTELSPAERISLMDVVFAVESGLRKLLNPAKINVASLGTAMPHVHWHIVPRFADDTHFPDPVWSAPLRDPSGRTVPEGFVAAMRQHLDQACSQSHWSESSDAAINGLSAAKPRGRQRERLSK